ncbi:MAG: hypothetical protein ACR2OH_00790 [Microthrixaceae bacterium]
MPDLGYGEVGPVPGALDADCVAGGEFHRVLEGVVGLPVEAPHGDVEQDLFVVGVGVGVDGEAERLADLVKVTEHGDRVRVVCNYLVACGFGDAGKVGRLSQCSQVAPRSTDLPRDAGQRG